MRDPFINAVIFILTIVSFVLIWSAAHGTVAKECEKLGAFYVGDKVYECRLKGIHNAS
jgi:hypothetical protein